MRDQAPPQGAQAALRAIRLLKMFTAEAPELQLAEISSLSALNKTTTHRLLQALLSEDLLDRNPGSGAYRLGPGMMALGVQALSSNDLRLRARPLLKRLAEETGETATLEVPIDDMMLILDEVTSKHFLGASGNVGTRWPIHATSTGKALIAFDQTGADRLGAKLSCLTSNTITEFDTLEKELDSTGEVLGALSICGPSQRMSESRRSQLGAILCKAASQLQPRY